MMVNGEGAIEVQQLRAAAHLRSDADALLMGWAAGEIERLKLENYNLRCKLQIANGLSVEDVKLDSHLMESTDAH